jgi:hypothetical protein
MTIKNRLTTLFSSLLTGFDPTGLAEMELRTEKRPAPFLTSVSGTAQNQFIWACYASRADRQWSEVISLSGGPGVPKLGLHTSKDTKQWRRGGHPPEHTPVWIVMGTEGSQHNDAPSP